MMLLHKLRTYCYGLPTPLDELQHKECVFARIMFSETIFDAAEKGFFWKKTVYKGRGN